MIITSNNKLSFNIPISILYPCTNNKDMFTFTIQVIQPAAYPT